MICFRRRLRFWIIAAQDNWAITQSPIHVFFPPWNNTRSLQHARYYRENKVMAPAKRYTMSAKIWAKGFLCRTFCLFLFLYIYRSTPCTLIRIWYATFTNSDYYWEMPTFWKTRLLENERRNPRDSNGTNSHIQGIRVSESIQTYSTFQYLR